MDLKRVKQNKKRHVNFRVGIALPRTKKTVIPKTE